MGIIKDPTSWRTGFELGLAGFSFPYSKPRKPVAYLYNGIRLPALPEWDRGVYPYAHITRANIGAWYVWYLNIAKTKLYYRKDSDGHDRMFTVDGSPIVYLLDGVSGDVNGATETGWNNLIEKTKEDGVLEHLPRWSNYDITYEDGTVYLAASEPIPVYE